MRYHPDRAWRHYYGSRTALGEIVVLGEIREPCENCGGTEWAHGTPGNRKGAIIRVDIDSAGLHFSPTSGTPVNVYICEVCGMIRLFAVRG